MWSYPEPIPECPKIKGYLCFFNEHVDEIRVDGKAVPRPVTPWSKDWKDKAATVPDQRGPVPGRKGGLRGGPLHCRCGPAAARSNRALLQGKTLMGTITGITSELVLSILQTHAAELRSSGIRHLALFGSVARGEAGPESDVDLLAELDPEAHIGLIRLAGIELRLGEILGRKVDFLAEPIAKERLRAQSSAIGAMSFKHDAADCLADVLDNVGRIERYVTGLSRDDFADDAKTYDAVERCLERVCEAMFRLGGRTAELMPGQPSAAIHGMGNRLRHAYDQIDLGLVWETIETDLPSLKTAAERALAALRAGHSNPGAETS